MALTNFYLQAGASDLNAGSTTGNSAVYTSTAGDWNNTTKVFTPTDGSTPASTVSVGDWIAAYLNAATITTYIAQVTAVGAGVNGTITVSSTIFVGASPGTGAGTVSLKAGGAWASPAVLATSAVGGGTAPVAMKINVKQATYSGLASATYGPTGTVTLPVWISGYHTTPGDLDADTTNSLSKPVWSYTAAAQATLTSAHQYISALSFIGSVSGSVLAGVSGTSHLIRCRVENTSSNASAFAVNANGTAHFLYCWFKAPTTATTTGVVSVASVATFIGCVAEGGGKAAWQMGNDARCVTCVALNPTGYGWLFGAGVIPFLVNCTVSGSTSDAVKLDATAAGSTGVIVGNLFTSVTGWGINNPSASNVDAVIRSCNDFYSCSSGDQTGFGDAPSWFQQDESSNPCASSTNVSIVTGALARAHGFPGVFENEPFLSYLTCGAVDPQTGSGTGSAVASVFIGG